MVVVHIIISIIVKNAFDFVLLLQLLNTLITSTSCTQAS